MKRIESTQNSLVKHWRKLVLTRKERDKSKEFLLEGFHLVEEALKQEDTILTLIVREGIELPTHWQTDGLQMVEITQAVADEIAETGSSQNVFAHCKQPETETKLQDTWKKLLLIDSVQDPGNIGTMIRTADAAGIDAVILGKGTADPFNPKTVRSAQGSHFNIPMLRGDLHEWIPTLKAAGIPVFGTGLTNAVNYMEADIDDKFAVILGNEGSGVKPEFLAQTDKNVMIPLYGKAESLNVAVATGILLYAYSRG